MGGLGEGRPKTGEQEGREGRVRRREARSESRGTGVDPEKSVGSFSSASSRAAARQAGLGCFLRRAGDVHTVFPFRNPEIGALESCMQPNGQSTAPNLDAIHAIHSGARMPDGLLEFSRRAPGRVAGLWGQEASSPYRHKPPAHPSSSLDAHPRRWVRWPWSEASSGRSCIGTLHLFRDWLLH
jgi:hypothetical protein